jgi:hypothetical protein
MPFHAASARYGRAQGLFRVAVFQPPASLQDTLMYLYFVYVRSKPGKGLLVNRCRTISGGRDVLEVSQGAFAAASCSLQYLNPDLSQTDWSTLGRTSVRARIGKLPKTEPFFDVISFHAVILPPSASCSNDPCVCRPGCWLLLLVLLLLARPFACTRR